VHIRRRSITALHMLIRIVKLASRRPLMVAVFLFAVVMAVLVSAVVEIMFLHVPPRYVVFGVDRRPSVMRLLESNILITRLSDDDDESDHVKPTETIGVFVVVGQSTTRQEASQPGTGSDWQCLSSYRYHIFIITSVTPDLFFGASKDRKQYVDDVNNTARQLRRGCIEAGSTSVILWQVQFRGSRVAPSVVADLVTEAYVDNFTWYDVIFAPRLTASFPEWGHWPPTELSVSPHVGVALKYDGVCTRVAFHRTHLDIFGDSWPHWLHTGADVARYLQDVYSDNSSALFNERAWLRRQV